MYQLTPTPGAGSYGGRFDLAELQNTWWKKKISTAVPSSLVPTLLWDPAPVLSPESWPVQTASRREQFDVVSLRLRHSPLTVESAFLQAPPAPGSTHRLWLFNSPRTGGLFKGDSWRTKRERWNWNTDRCGLCIKWFYSTYSNSVNLGQQFGVVLFHSFQALEHGSHMRLTKQKSIIWKAWAHTIEWRR